MNLFEEVKSITRTHCLISGLPDPYPKATDLHAQSTLDGGVTTGGQGHAQLRGPDLQAAQNRAFEGLVEQMVELIQVWGYEDCLAALDEADQRCEGKRTADDEERATR